MQVLLLAGQVWIVVAIVTWILGLKFRVEFAPNLRIRAMTQGQAERILASDLAEQVGFLQTAIVEHEREGYKALSRPDHESDEDWFARRRRQAAKLQVMADEAAAAVKRFVSDYDSPAALEARERPLKARVMSFFRSRTAVGQDVQNLIAAETEVDQLVGPVLPESKPDAFEEADEVPEPDPPATSESPEDPKV